MPLTSGTAVQSTGLPIWVRKERKDFYVIFILFDLILSEKHSNSFI